VKVDNTIREAFFTGGCLLEADATQQSTVDRVRALFGDQPVPLIVADPWYGEIVPEVGDTCAAVTGLPAGTEEAERRFVDWMIDWTNRWAELLAEGGAFYVWGGVGVPGFRPFYQYAHRVERETKLTIANHITWKKKRAYGVQHNYLFTREELLYLCKGDVRKPRCFHVPLTDKQRGYKGYNAKYPAKSDLLRRTNVWEEGDLSGGPPDEHTYLLGDVWDETEILRGKRHTCEKAKRVCEIPIEVHTEPGEGVIDLFSGSGSLSEAAARLGRAWIAVEGHPPYCEKIRTAMGGAV
jgi:DNA modification methylase